jgi:hypothetical protein
MRDRRTLARRMPLQILPKESLARADAAAKALLEHVVENQNALGLADAVVFYNFPLFREEERLLVAELVLISPLHGVLLVSTAPTGVKTSLSRLEGAY